MISKSTDGKTRVLSLSYGKDSLACLGAIEKLDLPLDKIAHAEVWATDDIPADLPPMVEFKKYADNVIKERYGIEVEHYCANKCDGIVKEKITYNDVFYKPMTVGKHIGGIRGFPCLKGPWCVKLKLNALRRIDCPNIIQYLGIASDEPVRLKRLDGIHKISPLVLIGWTEADAKQWCIENDLLSPIYTTANRGGCWFCHNQGVDQLRLLRKNYPYLWQLMLKWDVDSGVYFNPDGHTVHDYDLRFSLEDDCVLPNSRFNWKMLKEDNKNGNKLF